MFWKCGPKQRCEFQSRHCVLARAWSFNRSHSIHSARIVNVQINTCVRKWRFDRSNSSNTSVQKCWPEKRTYAICVFFLYKTYRSYRANNGWSDWNFIVVIYHRTHPQLCLSVSQATEYNQNNSKAPEPPRFQGAELQKDKLVSQTPQAKRSFS